MTSANPESIEDIYELSPLQQGMLFHTLSTPEIGLYFEQVSIRLGGRLNVPALARAWQHVVDRHSILRTSFHWEGLEKPLQVVHRQATLPIQRFDWRGHSSAEQQAQLMAYLKQDLEQGFDLTKAPLMRLAVVRLGEATYQFISSHHHIILDGWSVHLLNKEVSAYYQAFCRGRDLHLPQVAPYGDYIAWLQNQDSRQAERFWTLFLRGFAAPTPLHVDRRSGKRGDVERGYDEQNHRLSETTTKALQILARQHKLTLNTLILGAWALLLSRYSGDEDIVFGTVVSGRPPALGGVESMIGLLINNLPLRVQVPGQDLFLPWLNRLQDQQVSMRGYEYNSLMQIHGWSEVPRGTFLFDTIVVFENYPGITEAAELEDSQLVTHGAAAERLGFPITLQVSPGSRLWLKIMYDRRRFARDAIARLLGHLETLLEAMVVDSSRHLSEFSVLTPAERRQMLVEWNATRRDGACERGLTELFEAQVERTPEAIAYFSKEQQISYIELNRKANQLAHYLRQKGVGPEVLVAVCLERTLETMVGLVGILKAGGAYLPLDPSYPAERLAFMLEDAQVDILVTRSDLAHTLPREGLQLVLVDEEQGDLQDQSTADPGVDVQPGHLAYVLYTSGSTGTPKGVAVDHRQILNRLAWMWEEYPFARGEVACQKTALSFVDSIWELFGPLLQGVPTLVTSDEDLHDPRTLVDVLSFHRVSRIWLVPSFLQMLLDSYPDLQTRLPDLQFWVTTGEALSEELFQLFLQAMPQSTLYNLYGTTEVWDVTWYDTRQQTSAFQYMPIGFPIHNVEVYVLDRHLRPLPVGVPGELCVGGAGLARGYLNRPALTAERFIPHPFDAEPGARLYRTGDLVRFRPDGNIEFLGRMDHQVKLRGYRIELGEVESWLLRYPGVQKAVVISAAAQPPDSELIAYVVLQDASGTSSGLGGVQDQSMTQTARRRKVGGDGDGEQADTQSQARSEAQLVPQIADFLGQYLPDYMLPSRYVFLDEMPLTPSGKVDRRQLPTPDRTQPVALHDYEAPRNATEEVIAALFEEMLDLERVGIHDHFFSSLGGNSLLATQLVSRVRDSLQVELPLRRLFETPTVAGLATAVLGDPDTRATIERTAEVLLKVMQLSEEEVQARLLEHRRL